MLQINGKFKILVQNRNLDNDNRVNTFNCNLIAIVQSMIGKFIEYTKHNATDGNKEGNHGSISW